MNKYCVNGVKPELIMQMKMDPDAKCDKFYALTLKQYMCVYDEYFSQPAFRTMKLEKGRCAVCLFNRALRSKGLP